MHATCWRQEAFKKGGHYYRKLDPAKGGTTADEMAESEVVCTLTQYAQIHMHSRDARTYTRTCLYTCMHTYSHAYIHTYMHAYIHMYSCMYPRVRWVPRGRNATRMTSHCGRFVAPGQRITVGAVYDCKPMSQNRYRTVTLHRPLNLESPPGSLNGVRRVVMIVILTAMSKLTAIVEVVARANATHLRRARRLGSTGMAHRVQRGGLRHTGGEG